MYRAAAAVTAQDSAEDYYRINVFFPTLDSIVRDIELRFGQKQQQALEMSSLIPSCMLFDSGSEERQWQQEVSAVDIYKDIFSYLLIQLKCEFQLWRRQWQRVTQDDRPKSAIVSLDHCNYFPAVSTLLQLLATLPISTAEAERVFSKMERTLTAIRATMEETRLETLLLSQVHRSDTPSIQEVIDHFAVTSARRLNFVL